MSSRMKILATMILALGVIFSGCGGGGKAPVTVAISPGSATVLEGKAQAFTATLTNDTTTKGVTWTVTCSVPNCGTLSAVTTTSVTYTAPGPVASNLTVTLTATSIADTTKTGTATITVPAISVAVAPTTATVNAGSSTTITPTVTNDPSAAPSVNWTLTGTGCTGAACGSVSPASTASGTATTYTAPTTAPTSSFTVTVTATSATDNTKSASSTITVPAVSVSIAPSAPTVQEGQTKQFSATVNGTSNQSVTWTVTCGVATCGSLTSNTSNPTTYTAPGPPASTLTVTITATSVADATKSGQTTITVPAITVAMSPNAASVVVSTTKNFTATVGNDPSATPSVNWTLSGAGCAGATCGTLSSTSSASGTPVVYTAPATIPSPATVTLTATSATDGTKTGTATITVTAAPPIAVSVAPSTASVAVNGTQQFTPTVTNDPSATPSVNWTLSGTGCAGATCGTLSATSSASGTPVTYTAPATVPTPATVTLTATSVTDNTKTGTATITVTLAPACVSGGSESLLNGQYAFVLKGFDNGATPQPALVGGVISVDGAGHITAGALDMNLNAGVQTNLSVTSGSSFYGVGSDHRGCMVIATSAGTQNYRFSLGNISAGVASTGHVIDFDSAGPFTAGVMRKQNSAAFSTAQVSGNYAFGVSSPQNTGNGGGKFGAVGVINLAAGVVTGGQVDFNQNGTLDGIAANTTWPTNPISISSGGSYTISGTNGRGTLTFTPASASAAVSEVIYVVSATDLLILGTDAQTTNSAFAGEALQQSGTPFLANPLNGSYIGYDSGLGSTAGTTRSDLILLGPLSSGSSTLSGSQLRNDGGTFASNSIAGTYSVSTTGRLIVSGGGGHPPILYLASSSQAFFLDSNTAVGFGFFQSQSAGPFSNSSASGAYAFGTIDPGSANGGNNSGVATFTPGTTMVSVISDKNSNGSQNVGQTQSFTYSIDATGLVHIPTGCTISATSTTCQTVLFVISPTKAVVMDTSSSNPSIQVADQ